MIHHYTAAEYGIGHEIGEPIAPSVDGYEDYPDVSELYDFASRDVVAEVMHEVGYDGSWFNAELGIDPSDYPYSAKPLAEVHNIDASRDTKFHVTLEGHQSGNYYHQPQTWHISRLGNPLENKRFLKTAVQNHDYEPDELAALFDPTTTEEMTERLEYLGLIEDHTLEIGDEVVDLTDYCADPYKDPRLLEKFDKHGYSLYNVASELGVSKADVLKEARRFKLTDEA